MNNQARILIASLLLLASVAVSVYAYDQLPEKVPVHFDASGKANGWGPKSAATILPVCVMLFLAGVYAASIHIVKNKEYWEKRLRKPVSEQNFQKLVLNSMHTMDWVVLVIMVMFLTIQVESFLVATGKMKTLTGVWAFMAVLFAGVFYFLIQGLIARRDALKEPPKPDHILHIR
jgi:uncharacterized membrane protein